jgi:hypothetical protein
MEVKDSEKLCHEDITKHKEQLPNEWK